MLTLRGGCFWKSDQSSNIYFNACNQVNHPVPPNIFFFFNKGCYWPARIHWIPHGDTNVPSHQTADTSSSSQAGSNLHVTSSSRADGKRLVPLSSQMHGHIWVKAQPGQAAVSSIKVPSKKRLKRPRRIFLRENNLKNPVYYAASWMA